ncbi:hypothetical protein E1301_Tti006411 [Triplophysa tibetana]|uniref:Uncharacterized protein n=1 Tax=Triplophysa tibetana TaxID=1572043 RepID=A0A5A9P163_9TELE|nr:hypothetical protein E1301_Tti006411 [Triplophysa tibetana]
MTFPNEAYNVSGPFQIIRTGFLFFKRNMASCHVQLPITTVTFPSSGPFIHYKPPVTRPSPVQPIQCFCYNHFAVVGHPPPSPPWLR